MKLAVIHLREELIDGVPKTVACFCLVGTVESTQTFVDVVNIIEAVRDLLILGVFGAVRLNLLFKLLNLILSVCYLPVRGGNTAGGPAAIILRLFKVPSQDSDIDII